MYMLRPENEKDISYKYASRYDNEKQIYDMRDKIIDIKLGSELAYQIARSRHLKRKHVDVKLSMWDIATMYPDFYGIDSISASTHPKITVRILPDIVGLLCNGTCKGSNAYFDKKSKRKFVTKDGKFTFVIIPNHNRARYTIRIENLIAS